MIKQVNKVQTDAPPLNKVDQQAGAKLGQAQLKLGLDFILIFVDLVSVDLVQ